MRNKQDWYGGGWQQTFSGGRFFPLDPRVEEIFIEDIAHGLSHGAYRFAGQCDDPYTVAQHSCMVSDFMEHHKLEGLMHDSSEAYIGDLIRPLKHSGMLDAFRVIEHRLESAINETFGLESTPEIAAYIKSFDNRAVLTEKLHLFTRQVSGTAKDFEPFSVAYINVWGAKQAEEEFLNRFHKLREQKHAGK
jgi:5'-deoxynucleotidase YfbR-like HD superfamily hydrolase